MSPPTALPRAWWAAASTPAPTGAPSWPTLEPGMGASSASTTPCGTRRSPSGWRSYAWSTAGTSWRTCSEWEEPMSASPETVGTIYDIGYRHYDGPRRGRRGAMSAIVGPGLRALLGLGPAGLPDDRPW